MLATVLARFPIHRVILVADRGLLSLENISELTSLADQGGRTLEFILAVPARRYADLVETFQRLIFDETGLAESTFAGHRLIVAYDPLRAAEQSGRRRARIADLEAMAEKMVGKLDAQDGGQTARGRRASDRGAYSRFTRAVAEAELTRFIKADLNADRFSWSVDDDTVAKAELFDGKLALITNAPDLTAADAVARYKDLAGEYYETEWNLNPFIYQDDRYIYNKDIPDLVEGVERIAPENAASGRRYKMYTGSGDELHEKGAEDDGEGRSGRGL